VATIAGTGWTGLRSSGGRLRRELPLTASLLFFRHGSPGLPGGWTRGSPVGPGGVCGPCRFPPLSPPHLEAPVAMVASIDPTLLELFRSEVELHSETLTAGLLALEQSPGDEGTLERLMRAAHSIKGAARIVQLTPAAEVAHVMEDCFVAAQRKTLRITPTHIDAFLKGVDLLSQCSAGTREVDWDPARVAPLAADYTHRLQQLLHAPPPGQPPSMSPNGGPTPAGSVPAHTETPLNTGAAAGPGGSASPPGVVTVVCPPRLDWETAEVVRRQLVTRLDDTAAAGAGPVWLDLGGTVDLDAGGLALLVAAERHCAGRSRPLRLGPVSPTLRDVLQVVGLAHLLGDAGG